MSNSERSSMISGFYKMPIGKRVEFVKNFSDLTIGDGNLSEQEKNKLNNKLLFSPDIGTGSGAIYPIRRTKKNIENIIEDLFCQKREKLDEDDANFCARKMVFVYVDVTPLCGSAQKKGKQYFRYPAGREQ